MKTAVPLQVPWVRIPAHPFMEELAGRKTGPLVHGLVLRSDKSQLAWRSGGWSVGQPTKKPHRQRVQMGLGSRKRRSHSLFGCQNALGRIPRLVYTADGSCCRLSGGVCPINRQRCPACTSGGRGLDQRRRPNGAVEGEWPSGRSPTPHSRCALSPPLVSPCGRLRGRTNRLTRPS